MYTFCTSLLSSYMHSYSVDQVLPCCSTSTVDARAIVILDESITCTPGVCSIGANSVMVSHNAVGGVAVDYQSYGSLGYCSEHE